MGLRILVGRNDAVDITTETLSAQRQNQMFVLVNRTFDLLILRMGIHRP
jgi:hypothetical protein